MDGLSEPEPPLIRLFDDGGPLGRRLVSDTAFVEGQIIGSISGCEILDHPTRTSVYVGHGRHLDGLGLITNLNHSCAPSTVLDTTRLLLIAARNLTPGDGLTFFYPSTEWDMAEPFDCLCGAADCVGHMRGAKYLGPDVLDRYFLNRHIVELLDEQRAEAARLALFTSRTRLGAPAA